MRQYKYFFYALLVVFIDQIVKIMVKLNMEYDGEIELLGSGRPAFKIHFLENPGAAFGMTLQNFANILGWEVTPDTAKLILSLFSLVSIIIIGYFLYILSTHKSLLPLFYSFVLGGAVGNMIDRVFYGVWFASMNNYQGGLMHGRVVDMFYFDIWEGMIGGTYISLWPVFNVADTAIEIGTLISILFLKRFMKQDTEETIKKLLERK